MAKLIKINDEWDKVVYESDKPIKVKRKRINAKEVPHSTKNKKYKRGRRLNYKFPDPDGT